MSASVWWGICGSGRRERDCFRLEATFEPGADEWEDACEPHGQVQECLGKSCVRLVMGRAEEELVM